jgi:LPS-assembly lipoprotein
MPARKILGCAVSFELETASVLVLASFGRRAASFVWLAAMVLVAGCGFHLRGDMGLPFAKLYVSGNNPSSPTVGQLKQALGTTPHTKLVAKADDAEASLLVLSEEREKVISALSSAGRVREYELRLRVTFRLTDDKANELIPLSEIALFRLVSYNDTQILSKGAEEALLYTDMQNDIVQQILRRVAAAKSHA